MRLKLYAILGLKLALAAGLFWIILRQVDPDQMLASLESIPTGAWIAILLLPLAQAILLGLRWRMVAMTFGCPMDRRSSILATLVSLFFSQGLPATVGGDAFRVWWQTRSGVPVSVAAMTVLTDRLVGFVTLVWLTAMSLYVLSYRTHDSLIVDGLKAVVVVIVVSTVVVLFLARFDLLPAAAPRGEGQTRALVKLYRWCRDCLGFVKLVSVPNGVIITALAACVHLLTTLMIYVVASSMSQVSFLDVFAASTLALLITYLPISIAGWGVREATIVTGFGIIGVAAEVALPVSVLVGLSVLVVSLLGGAYWVLSGLKRTFLGSHGVIES